MSKSTSKPPIENQQTPDPVEDAGGSPSERSRLRAATAIQSSVDPEDYPKADRDEQVTAATGRRRKAPDKH